MGTDARSSTETRYEALPPAREEQGNVTPALVERLRRRIVLASGEHAELEVRAPATGTLLGSIPRGTPADVEAAIARARAAQPLWRATSFADRARIILRFHDLVLARQEEILDLIQLESGKARSHAFEEVGDVANVARYYALRAERFLHPRRRHGALPGLTTAWELRHPIGVCGFIVPWNYPFNLAVTDAIPALMAGNTALIKPDHQTSFTALWAADLLYEAGLPPDVMPVVTGVGPELGPAIVGGVDFVMFTGSTRTGRTIATLAAPRLIGYSLELGGKNAMLVLDDADVDRAVDGAVRGCFVGAGQVCVSIERIFVDARIWDRFIGRFVEAAKALKLSPALDYSGEVGSLTSERQLTTVREHLADALAKGATLLAGGNPRPDIGPLFFEPTILTGVTPDMRCFAEETFGPVVALYRFDDVEDAIQLANATPYGLNGSVWTRNGRRGMAVAARLQVGTVNVNEAYAATWGSVDAPIGGFKESGLMRRHGRDGILKYTEAQTVAVQRLLPMAAPTGISARSYSRIMTRALQILRHVPGLR